MAIRLAGNARLGLAFGAASVFYRSAFFSNEYFLVRAELEHFKRGKYSGGTCADYQYVVFLHLKFYLS
jgi:hypothetical protein